MDENPADGSGDEAKIGRFSRRSVIRLGSLAGVAAAGGMGTLAFGTGGARAEVSGAGLEAETASVSSDDGTITDVSLGDERDGDGEGINFTWEGFDQSTVTVTYTLEAHLTGNGGDDTTTESSTDFEEMLSSTNDVNNTSGSVSLDWADALGASTVSLTDTHTQIGTGDFESTTDGGQRVRELEVRLTANADHDNGDVTVEDVQRATSKLTTDNIIWVTAPRAAPSIPPWRRKQPSRPFDQRLHVLGASAPPISHESERREYASPGTIFRLLPTTITTCRSLRTHQNIWIETPRVIVLYGR